MGQHFQGGLKGNQIPGAGRLVADPADETLQIVHRVQILSQFFPGNIIHVQFLHRILTAEDL